MNTRTQMLHNLFADDLIRRIVCIRYNHDILKFVNKIARVDSIANYDLFRQEIKKIPKAAFGTSYTVKRSYSENFMYGYAEQIMRYAGLEKEKMIYLPLLEHGVDLKKGFFPERYAQGMSYIMQGNEREEDWKKHRNEYAFSIGPYIHYSDSYYSEEMMKELKTKQGRTLLVFPPHTSEYGDDGFIMDDFFRVVFDEIGNDYDTIVACVFWIDVEKDYILEMECRGAKLVSAGFKLDGNFVKRLRTIIELSDTVLFPSFSTSIGYAYYLNKRVICVSCDVKEGYRTDYNDTYKAEFCKIFGKEFSAFEDEAYRLVDDYWGLSLLRSKEEIKEMYLKNKSRILRRAGF